MRFHTSFMCFLFHTPTTFPTYVKRTLLLFTPASRTPDLCPCGSISSSDHNHYTIVEYRMNVHLFGAVSSPAMSNFGLKATAEKGRETHGKDAASFLRKEFYVGDGLTSFDTPENAITIIKKSQAMCAASQLRLHKFASSSKEILQALPPDDGAKTLKNLDLRRNILPDKGLWVHFGVWKRIHLG